MSSWVSKPAKPLLGSTKRTFSDSTSWRQFPIGRDESGGWRLDIVALLAVTGESFIGEHAQALTSSKLCLLPRIMPAPHALLQPRRPASLPREIAKVCGVHSGVDLESLSFFANIIHPIDQLRPFAFKVLEIQHRGSLSSVTRFERSAQLAGKNGSEKTMDAPTTTGIDPEAGDSAQQGLRRRSTMQQKFADFASNAPTVDVTRGTTRASIPGRGGDGAVGAAFYSPLHILTVVSFLITIGLFIAGALWRDGTALLAVGLASITTTTISYAARWKPFMTGRATSGAEALPPGDIIIRTREGAFLLIKCTEQVARELYSGVDECRYVVTGYKYRLLMTLSAAFLMPSVILLGNCGFNMQALVGAAYLFLNIAYWMVGLLPLDRSWDLSRYEARDVTPDDARKADGGDWTMRFDSSAEDYPSFTRTLWFAIRETRASGWAERSGSIPPTPAWRKWTVEALAEARQGNRSWRAVSRKNEIMVDFVSERPLDG